MLFPYIAKAMRNPWVYEYAYGYFNFFAGKNPDAAPLFEKYIVDERCQEIYDYLVNGGKRPEGDYWLQRRFNGLRTYFDILKYFQSIPIEERYKYIDGTLPTLSGVGETLEERRASQTYLKIYLQSLIPQGWEREDEYMRSQNEQGQVIPHEWKKYLPPAEFTLPTRAMATLGDLKSDLVLEFGDKLGYMIEICPLLNPYLPNSGRFLNPFNNKEALEKLGIQSCYHKFNFYFDKEGDSAPIFFTISPEISRVRKFYKKTGVILKCDKSTKTTQEVRDNWEPFFVNRPHDFKLDDAVVAKARELVKQHNLDFNDPRFVDVDLAKGLER